MTYKEHLLNKGYCKNDPQLELRMKKKQQSHSGGHHSYSPTKSQGGNSTPTQWYGATPDAPSLPPLPRYRGGESKANRSVPPIHTPYLSSTNRRLTKETWSPRFAKDAFKEKTTNSTTMTIKCFKQQQHLKSAPTSFAIAATFGK